MIKVIFLIIFINLSNAEGLTVQEVDEIAESIYKIEGAGGTKYPFGIRSIKIQGNTDQERFNFAQKACKQTIINNYKRWQKTNKEVDYLTFLGNKYCPISDKGDINGLNKNWIKNIKHYITFEIK